MPTIKENLDRINKQILETAVLCGRKPETIQLIAVSKKKSVGTIKEAIEAGAKDLGENYLSERNKSNILRNLNKNAKYMGYKLVPTEQ